MPIIEEGLGALSLLEGLNGGNGQPSNDLNFNISLVRGHRAHSSSTTPAAILDHISHV